MEYFLGSFVTLLILFVASRLFKNKINSVPKLRLQHTQSYSHEMLKFLLPTNGELLSYTLSTQATSHKEKTTMRVLMIRDKAYWIKDNMFYSADLRDGEVLSETARQVDTMGMDRVQLEEIIFIVDQLTGGTGNDSGYPGKPKL